jgi:hypothetical protein
MMFMKKIMLSFIPFALVGLIIFIHNNVLSFESQKEKIINKYDFSDSDPIDLNPAALSKNGSIIITSQDNYLPKINKLTDKSLYMCLPEESISIVPTPVISQNPYIEDDSAKQTFYNNIVIWPISVTPNPSPKPITQMIQDLVCKDQRTWTTFPYKNIIENVASKYKLDPQLIYATIMTESNGNVYAYRYEPDIKDASLCMGQILISTARSLGFRGNPNDMYKPEICIDLIGKYHRIMLNEFGDLTPNQLATAYNAGSPWNQPVPGHLYRFDIWYNGGEI